MSMKAIVVLLGVSFVSLAFAETEKIDQALGYGNEITHILVSKILRDFTGLGYFEEKYHSLGLQVIKRNITDFVQEKVNSLKKIFKDREDLVKKIAAEAEKLRNDSGIDSLTAENVTFYHALTSTNTSDSIDGDSNKIFYRNAKCKCDYQRPEGVQESQCTEPIGEYVPSGHFGNYNVSYESSSVHIPTEVYNEGPAALKDIYLSHGIDRVMRDEVCKESNYSHFSRWVYFTTQEGIMRFFPDRKWSNDCQTPDVYDSRTSPWYLNAISSPKDIIVLVDRSGSVEGSTLNLLRRSVRDFLDTVTTNDFINIILFNEEANFINGQCQGLLQGTPRNKQILQNWMEEYVTGDQAFYEEGFNLTLKTLDNVQQPGSKTARCNPIVMFFTDGDSVYPDDAIRRWNANEDKRIFSFTVGKNFYGKSVTKEIACKNRGYSNTVPSFTATKEAAHNYLVKISEPLTTAREMSVKWTLPYQDQFGLGFVISASVPVKEMNEGKKGIAGVVGTDMSLDDLKDFVMEPDMGEDYYPFLVDNNGFAVIHPNLREENHDSIMSVDFIELEHRNLEKIRQNILNGENGTESERKDLIMEKKYLLTSLYTYDYAPVEGTIFKFGICTHSSKLSRLDSVSALRTYYPDLTFRKLVDEQRSDTIALLYSNPCISRDTRSFNPCEATTDTVTRQSFENGLPLQEFNAESCDTSSYIYADLLLHAYLSDNLAVEQWEKNSSISSESGILALFTALESPSFIRLKYLNFTQQTGGTIEKGDDSVKEEIKAILANPKNSSYLRRPTLTHTDTKPAWTTYYSFVETPIIKDSMPETTTPLMQNTEQATSSQAPIPTMTATPPDVKRVKSGYIVVSRAVQLISGTSVAVPVMTGVVLDPETFQRNIFNLAYKCNDTSNCNSDDWNLLCNDTENTECLILDDGGYLLSSNQEKHFEMVNQFLGLIDGEFMRTLIDESVFSKTYTYDYQAICEKTVSDKSAGVRGCFVPTITDMLSFGWWLSSCARMFFHTFFQSLFVGLWSLMNFGSAHVSVEPGGTLLPVNRELCIKKTPVLSFGQNSRGTHFGTFRCTESCERSYTVVRIEGTNLLVAIADTAVNCGGGCTIVAPLSNADSEVTILESCKNETRYRKPPEDTCYDVRNYSKALDSPCSSTMKILPHSNMPLFFFTIFIFSIIERFMS